ncbi:uncharacterized protein STEHIDRAFT_147130 [Stereum hirsutum FP-91666 SS1]|uniref:uncharacterized protein n=1 Tax=Stereum hirsutum (strain FP-91666) TaxID=721885 RepID=UPI000440D60B|nr:uncharacterized protein STEHIDRAFT_147130 [Stereum hirsutum FP-91666 SS1]EIM86567.1 hypothetical protein STEHIDRAFT_147130 [Stereum hirsutum FP-91666 SS1]
MSALTASVSRTGASLASCKVSLRAGPSVLTVQHQQMRGYAQQKRKVPVKKTSQSFKVKGGPGGLGTGPKRARATGIFRPMSANQLTHPIFQAGGVDGLEGMPEFQPLALPESAGKALAFPNPENHIIQTFGVPKNLVLEWRLLSKPVSVVRDMTLDLVQKLDAASSKSSEGNRFVLGGPKGSGKSLLLLQAVEYAAASNWLVLYIPRGIDLVNSSSNYVYDLRTQSYYQPNFAFQTLQRFKIVNAKLLEGLKVHRDVEIERHETVKGGVPLAELIEVGVQDKTVAPTVLEAMLECLGAQTELPVLVAVDDFQALFCKSAYRDPLYGSLRAWHLSMPRLLLEYASGRRTFARGAFVGAISSTSNTYALTPEVRYALGFQQDLQPSPYIKVPEEVKIYTKGIKALDVPEKLSVSEAAALFEVWMKNKTLHTNPTDELFMTKYTESSGNARDFVWRGLLATLASH